MAESLQTYLTTKTWTRAEWEAAQTKGTEGGFVAYAQIKTPYEEYLKNAGFKDEAAAMAKRAEEDAAGTQFGEIQSNDVKKLLSERKITPEYAKELDDAHARARAEEAKRVALLSKGYITGQEPVYIPGTPENKAWWEAEIARAKASGTTPEPPDPYLDAQAFAARWDEYHRYGATSPTYKSYDATTNQFTELPNPFFNAQVLVPKVGMGNQWYKLERAKWATVKPGVGSTKATEQAGYNLLNFFSRTVADANGNPMPAGMRFFMRAPGDITNTGVGTTNKTILNTTQDPNGNTITNYSDGSSTSTDSDGVVTDLTGSTSDNPLDETAVATKKAERVSAYNTLYEEFNKYGLGMLVSDIKNYLIDNSFDPSEFSIKLQNTAAYQNRFSANKDRIKAGLGALSPAEYIRLEDQYQNVMRNYGLPSTYWKQTVDPVTGVTSQQGFNQLIANDVDSIELEDRIMTAQQRVVNANPEVLRALKEFYPDIQNGDILAYVLDPANARDVIKRKVTAAEIGGAQMGAGLTATKVRAEELQKAGITKQRYQEDAATIAEDTMRGGQLAEFYKQNPYTQQTAEANVLNLPGSAEAKRQTKQLTSLETAKFSGRSGTGAIARDRAGVI
jgi:hypothetical protein